MSYKEYLIEKLNEEVEDWKEVSGQKIRSSIKNDLQLKSGDVIPQGTNIEFVFVEKDRQYRIKIIKTDNAQVKVPILLKAYNQNIKAINKIPGEKALEKYVMDGRGKTVTGKVTEPDGTSYDGSPSWLLVLGMI